MAKAEISNKAMEALRYAGFGLVVSNAPERSKINRRENKINRKVLSDNPNHTDKYKKQLNNS